MEHIEEDTVTTHTMDVLDLLRKHTEEPDLDFLREALRILRPGGHFFIVDNDLREGDFAALLREFGYAAEPGLADRIDAFWAGRGFAAETVMSEWRAPSRGALERVVRMEFGDAAEAAMARLPGHRIGYGYRIYHRAR